MKLSNKEKARIEAKKLWIKGCKFDGIDPAEKFVSWSTGNPFYEPYNKAMGRYLYFRSLENSISVF